MPTPQLINHPDRLFPADTEQRAIARELYATIRELPIVSPHGHTDPSWFADNTPFANPTELLIQPDHYLFRMLYSQGISLEALGIGDVAASRVEIDPKDVWTTFANHYYLFRGTPSRIWMDHVFGEVFGIDTPLSKDTANLYYDTIAQALNTPEFLPRALYDQFDIELLATTESPLDNLHHHATIQQSDWPGRVITTFRPDPVVDPEFEHFAENLTRLGELTKRDTTTYSGYLDALRASRQSFIQHGATATDHGHPTAKTAQLTDAEADALFQRVKANATPEDAELFRAHMLMQMAAMSLDDGLVMQLHPGSYRNHNTPLFLQYGRDKGADIPTQTNYVDALKPLLDAYGNHPEFTLIVFTLDETSYSRELAPLAGHYPCLKLGPAWWFHDSPEGMRRCREQTIETAGFYNTVGFNDDTRAFLSIPARHDMARRIDCGYLAKLIAEHRLQESEAFELAADLAGELARRAYKLPCQLKDYPRR